MPLALLCLSCARPKAEPAPPPVALLRLADQLDSRESQAMPKGLTPFALDAGTKPLRQRAAAPIAAALALSGLAAVIVEPAPKGSVDAIKAAKPPAGLRWILVDPEDDRLAVENLADLVVELAVPPPAEAARLAALESGLVDLVARVARGEGRIDDKTLIAKALGAATGHEWTVEYSLDPAIAVPARAHVVVAEKK